MKTWMIITVSRRAPRSLGSALPSINILWNKKLRICNKQIHQDVFNFKPLLPPKMGVILLSALEKSSNLNQERNMHRSSTVYKLKQSKTVHKYDKYRHIDKYVGGSWCERTAEDGLFPLEVALLSIMDSYFGQKQRFKVLITDLFLTNMKPLASQDVNWWTERVWITCGLLWCFYQLFGLSFWWHPFTAEDPLVSKWCDAKFLQICSIEETNSS